MSVAGFAPLLRGEASGFFASGGFGVLVFQKLKPL
jgi:hypothetical protein